MRSCSQIRRSNTRRLIGAQQRCLPDDVPTAAQIAAMTATQYKTYTTRLRRMAARRLLALHRTRRRDKGAWDYARYTVLDSDGQTVFSGTLRDVHLYLIRPR
jgi:hypothetical protein